MYKYIYTYKKVKSQLVNKLDRIMSEEQIL